MTRIPRTAQTRRRLLDAGRTLFARHGAEAVTSHAIAAEAGYASGTFYLHFKHKQALFQELADEAANELESRLAAFAAADLDPRRLVEAQSAALVGFAEDHRDLFQIIFRPGGEAAETGARLLARLARGVSARRRAAIAEGRAFECLDSDVLAQAIVGMWVQVLGWWVADPTRASRDDVVRTLVHVQLHGTRATRTSRCALASSASDTKRAPRSKRPEGARRS